MWLILEFYTPWNISGTARLETLNFVYGLAMWIISFVVTECLQSGHGQGHVSYICILDLENFTTASLRCTGVIKSTVSLWSASWLNARVYHTLWLNARVYHTLVDCNPLTPLLRFVLDLLYKLYLHCCAAVSKIVTDSLRPAVRLWQHSFLFIINIATTVHCGTAIKWRHGADFQKTAEDISI